MLLDRKRLIDRSIADLTHLAALLEAEVADSEVPQTPELRACEEICAILLL